MTGCQSVEFHEALEMVELLSAAQQENLIEIIRHSLTESGWDSISRNVQAAREEYARGEVRTGTVDDPVAEQYLRETGPQSTPSLMDLCSVDGERCFSSTEEVDEYIRGLRDE